jgi:Putative SAM-dependent methyltransferase
MNCFQLVKNVLEDLYKEIREEHKSCTDDIIKLRLSYLSKKYENLEDFNPADIDYNDPATQFAYVYRYTTAHANIVFQLIRDIKTLTDAFDVEKLTVGCLGGGPGSDILGILKFMYLRGASPNGLKRLTFTICDKEPAWSETWHNVDGKIETPFSFSVSNHFLSADVTEVKALRTAQRISGARLFTMIYFLSEIYANREDTRGFFVHLFDKAEPGTLLFFVDNSRHAFYSWFDEVAISAGLEIVANEDYFLFQTEADEDKEALGLYYGKFGYPKLKAEIAYRVYRKKSAETSWDYSF